MARDNDASDDGRTVTDKLDRRRFIQTTGAGAAMAGLAGCIPDSGGESTPTPGDDGTPTPTGPETPPPPEGGLTIGHLHPPNALGLGSVRAAEMAVGELNANGGVMDQDVELIHADTRADPGTAQTETQALIQEEDVDVLIGTFVSEVTQRILDITADFGIPIIVTGSAAPSTVTDFIGQNYERYKNFFRTGPINSNLQAEALASYADYLSARHGFTDFAFLADRAAWTEPFQDQLPGFLEEKGYNIVHQNRLSITIDDWSSVMDNLAGSGAQAVMRFFAHITATGMLGRWHQGQYPFAIEGIHVASMLPSWPQATGGIGIYETTSQSGAGGAAAITEKTIPFVEAYREQFGEAESPPRGHPMYMGFGTYDAIHSYKAVVEDAGTWEYEQYLDNIVDSFLNVEYPGVTGTIEVYGPDAEYPHDAKENRGPSGQIQNFPVTQWQPEEDGPGTLECVFPGKFRTSDHMKPHWM